MYFLAFIKWMYTKELEDGEQRFIFTAWGLGTFLAIVAIISLVMWSWAPVLYYLAMCAALLVLFLISQFFLFVRRCYIRWQTEVFDKLKG